MWKWIVFGSLFLILGEPTLRADAIWTCSTEVHPWVQMPGVKLVANDLDAFGSFIAVDRGKTFQAIDGWGGCFNERGWKAMAALSDANRADLMRKLFDAEQGLNLNICRSPIGSSDYAISLYSLDEVAGDYAMEHFSIDRDRQMLIPYIKAALSLRPDLRVWGVPWSPPAWMKDSNKLAGGHIKDDDKTFEALALYFVKYVQAYRAEGIPLYMVMPQNEPAYSTGYSSCEWTGKQLADFIGKHLGPAMKRSNVDCEIDLGTIPRSDPQNYVYFVAPALDDPVTSACITGVGCQWSGDQTMRDTRFIHPEKKLMQTENECGAKNTNDFAFAMHQFDRAQTYFNSGASASMIWNLVLDETGLSTAGWAQCSPVVVDRKSGKVTYTPYYYCYKHFSHFVKPGARRIAIEGGWGKKIAFVNPDGQVVVILANDDPKEKPMAVDVAGKTMKVTLPAKSFSTIVLDK